MSLKIQYTIVAAIIIAACIWMIIRFVKMRKNQSCGCDKGELHSKQAKDPQACVGCALSDACKTKSTKKK